MVLDYRVGPGGDLSFLVLVGHTLYCGTAARVMADGQGTVDCGVRGCWLCCCGM